MRSWYFGPPNKKRTIASRWRHRFTMVLLGMDRLVKPYSCFSLIACLIS